MSGSSSTAVGASISRRNFLKLGATATAALGLVGCDNTLDKADPDKEYLTEERWIPVTCWVDCGGKCPRRALVKDGTVLRLKGDDTHEDSVEYPQQRSCARGRALRHYVLSDARLKYPMKRKSWQPGGGKDNVHPELRGKDEWERISWDEATTLIADEMTRIIGTYGNEALLNTDSMHTEPHNLFNKLGGSAVAYMTASYGSWQNGAYDVGSGYDTTESCLDRFELMKSDLIVLWGVNPAWSSAGNPAYILKNCKDAGAKFIGIDPFYNDTYNAVDAEWIPVRPGTDMALLFGMIYTLLDEDDPDTNPMIDWEFIKNCTIGFDEETAPEGATENLKDYVLGKYDDTPKTPEWAEEICGVSSDKIREFTRELSPSRNVSLITGYAPARTFNTDNLPQLFLTLGALTGHIGKSGNMTGIGNFWNALNGGMPLVQTGNTYTDLFTSYSGVFNDPREGNPLGYSDVITVESKQTYKNLFPNKKVIDCGECLFNEVTPAREREMDCRMIWSAFCNMINVYPDPNLGIKGLREGDVELVVRSDIEFTPTAQYADIVLPAITPWERPGGSAEYYYHPREALIYYFQVMEPLFEAQDDQWIVREVGKKMGLGEKDLFPVSRRSQEFIHMAGARWYEPDGTEHPLVTITQEDIDEYGLEDLEEYLETAETVENEGGAGGTEGIENVIEPFVIQPQEGLITVSELKERGVFQYEREAGDGYGYVPLQGLREDPENNPAHTESGKIEIYCQVLADKINGMGYGQDGKGGGEIKPYPTYIKPLQGYEATFSDWENKVKGEYPYQVINPHYMGRQHSCCNNVDWLREAFDNPVYINAGDGKAEGLQDGDTVLLTSAYGKSIRRACLTQRMMPGVIGMPHGAWLRLDEETGIDQGGHDNTLVSSASTGQTVDAYNSTMVNIQKYDGEALPSHAEEPVVSAPVE